MQYTCLEKDSPVIKAKKHGNSTAPGRYLLIMPTKTDGQSSFKICFLWPGMTMNNRSNIILKVVIVLYRKRMKCAS